MPMYAIATIPLIKKLQCNDGNVKQVRYADDVCAAGKITQLREWWRHLSSQGYSNTNKTWLVTKEKHLAAATASFADTDVQITSEGRLYLGAAVGSYRGICVLTCGRQSCKMGGRAGMFANNCFNAISCYPCSLYSWPIQ